MQALFVRLLSMGIYAGWLVIALVLLRPFLRKVPKWITCLLWGIVAARLLIPVFVQSDLSLLPTRPVADQTNSVSTGIPVLNSAIAASQVSGSTTQDLLPIAANIWLLGIGCMWVYYGISFLLIRRRTRARISLQSRVWLCDDVPSPFILGVFRPAIYLPSGITEPQLAYVLAHENAHISRRDHLWKPLGFALLSIYWYNPLIWVGYILLCRDIEQACDEKVIAQMTPSQRLHYSEALVYCSVRRRNVLACPVAFGEVGVKSRIKNVLSYKKPSFWILMAALLVSIGLTVGFLTDPKPCAHQYDQAITVSATCTDAGEYTYTCRHCAYSYTEPIAMRSHSFGQPKTVRSATCTQEGILESRCADCGYVETASIACVPHTLGETFVTAEPCCSQTGMLSAQCSGCSGTFPVEELPTNGVHTLQSTVVKAATCSAEGEELFTCTHCDYAESHAIPMCAHTYTQTASAVSTCTKNGFIRYTCDACADWYSVTLPLAEPSPIAMHGSEHCAACLAKFNVIPSFYSSSSGNFNTVLFDTKTKWPSDESMFPIVRWDLAHP